jgi:hypothetical protein
MIEFWKDEVTMLTVNIPPELGIRAISPNEVPKVERSSCAN